MTYAGWHTLPHSFEVAPGYSINGYGIQVGVMIEVVQASLLGSESASSQGGLSTVFWIDSEERLHSLLVTRTRSPLAEKDGTAEPEGMIFYALAAAKVSQSQT